MWVNNLLKVITRWKSVTARIWTRDLSQVPCAVESEWIWGKIQPTKSTDPVKRVEYRSPMEVRPISTAQRSTPGPLATCCPAKCECDRCIWCYYSTQVNGTVVVRCRGAGTVTSMGAPATASNCMRWANMVCISMVTTCNIDRCLGCLCI